MSENAAEEEEAAYKVSIDIPQMAEGEEIQIAGLGTFKNGQTYEVTKAEEEAWRNYNQTVQPVIDEETNEVLNFESTPGPPLMETAPFIYGVTVEDLSSGEKSKSREEVIAEQVKEQEEKSDESIYEPGDDTPPELDPVDPDSQAAKEEKEKADKEEKADKAPKEGDQ